MKKIRIKSNKPLMFPPMHRGFVRMEIDLIQNKPTERQYTLRIVDTCFELEDVVEHTEDGGTRTVKREKILGQLNTRFKTMSYDELDAIVLASQGSMGRVSLSVTAVNTIFQQGLLMVTRKECQEGKGMYFSKMEDWELEE